ncbi:MAG TPA: hypothetical protein VEZ50_09945, partial [Nodosilinea sp.]|nr:hypothetical protein [Nodosilinea sp.]
MKAIQELVAAVERWWALDRQAMKPIPPRPTLVPRAPVLEPRLSDQGAISPSQTQPKRLLRGRLQPCRPLRRRKNIRHPRLAFMLTTLGLTAILGQRFYNQPGLQVGSIAPNTVFA